MKYIYLLLSSLVLSCCSGSSNVADSSLYVIPSDLIKYIARFLEPKEVAKWRNVNKLNRACLPLKTTVEQIFNISGLESVAENEPELAGVMRLPLNRCNPLIFFSALMEDIIAGNKHYDILFRPLILHLIQTFRQLGDEEKQDYTQDFETRTRFNLGVERYMLKICSMRGHFDLVFEILNGNSRTSRLAFLDAAEWGYDSTVYLLLQRCSDIITDDFFGISLLKAVQKGHISTVDIILQYGTDISIDDVCYVLRSAVLEGNFTTIESFFKHRTDIPSDYVTFALLGAAGNGHLHIVDLILQYRKDIRDDIIDYARENAVKNARQAI
jgi:hypothetical protein